MKNAIQIKSNIVVLVDDREKNESLINILKSEKNVTLEKRRLFLGDYQFDDCLIVERKTIPDLYMSLKDGRLFLQASRLTKPSCTVIMILEEENQIPQGRHPGKKFPDIRIEAVRGALISLSIVFGIPVFRSKGPEDTVRIMLHCFRVIKKGITGLHYRHSSFKGPGKYNKRRKLQIHILQGIPGIGPVIADRLLDKFGSLRSIFNADTRELRKVSGIGQFNAKNINRILD